MKGKQLRKAVLLGMAMSMAVWTTGMAKDITGPITDESYNKEYNEEVTVTNDDPMQAAIQVANKEVTISTGDKFDIHLNSYGSGIRTGNEDNNTSTKSAVEVISSGNNIIQFNMESGSEGNGITVEDNSNVTVTATGENHIFSENPSPKVGDGIRIAGNGTASVTGQYNTISVGDDGLYLSRKNGNDATITLTATGANADGIGNYLEGNNGIHTDGAGTIYVTASNGKNVILGKENAVHASGSATINIIASGNST